MENGFWIRVELEGENSFEGTVLSYDKDTVLLKMEGETICIQKSTIRGIEDALCWSD